MKKSKLRGHSIIHVRGSWLFEDVVNELNLSGTVIEKHGSLGTPPSELVRLVIEQKDSEIAALKKGVKVIYYG